MQILHYNTTLVDLLSGSVKEEIREVTLQPSTPRLAVNSMAQIASYPVLY